MKGYAAVLRLKFPLMMGCYYLQMRFRAFEHKAPSRPLAQYDVSVHY